MGAYQLKIKIEGSKPVVWRRLMIDEGATFQTLAQAINIAFGWGGYHLHGFEFPERDIHIDMADEEGLMADFGMESLDEAKEALNKWLKAGETLLYIYDFGDDWIHQVEVEAYHPDQIQEAPEVTAYRGDNFIEDCGGPYGYYELVGRLKDKKDPERKALLAWAQDSGYGEAYNLKAVNEELLEDGQWDEDILYDDELLGDEGKFFNALPNPFVSGEMPVRIVGDTPESILRQFTVSELKEYARELRIERPYKLRKAELIDAITAKICDPQQITWDFSVAYREEVDHLLEGMKTGNLPFRSDFPALLLFNGYAYEEEDGIAIPRQVATALKKTLKSASFEKQRAKESRYREYLETCLNLYGICDDEQPGKVMATCTGESPDYWSFEHLVSRCPFLRDALCLKDGYWMPWFFSERDMASPLLQEQGDKPYYMPTVQEVETHFAGDTLQETPQAWALVQELIHRHHLHRDKAREMCTRLQFWTKIGLSLRDTFSAFTQELDDSLDDAAMERLAPLLMAFHNSTRMYSNRGFTPDELSGPVASELQQMGKPGKILAFPGKQK
ncbi:IS1096 element passenger TnpR family protein [Eubacterium aggregans]|uniref:IS1096 element passenger TnpR family protein n=1 Tax=Eubacterium aggregans TaxID=81409 RepID=UPI0023F24193|nr:Rho termination factor N-terminal domain-containing protein [Eubacterium aggregans]MDD4691323.1 Rho termination factor N-terminal domain-containing protein [Eubacterium aggregans]